MKTQLEIIHQQKHAADELHICMSTSTETKNVHAGESENCERGKWGKFSQLENFPWLSIRAFLMRKQNEIIERKNFRRRERFPIKKNS